MNTSLSLLNHEEGVSFNFNTVYMGKEITLNVVSDKERFTVKHNDKTIGHIKIGDVRHTWYVVDSNYPAPYFVDEIGNEIEARYKNLIFN
jgi:hypothetical protein